MDYSIDRRHAGPFDLVTAGHHFLLNVTPLRKPNSFDALRQFIGTASRIDISAMELDAVLLRCLVVLGRHATFSVPSLFERYLANTFLLHDPLRRFSECIEDALLYHCIENRTVQEAIHVINKGYADSGCTASSVAATLHVRLSTLDVAFQRETGHSPTEHIRDVRLERSAILLATTNLSIKEVWARVGYNHHSNYDHDFKHSFGVAPREYRARAIGPLAREMWHARQATIGPTEADKSSRNQRVLIIDDDEGTRIILERYLKLRGYSVFCAATGVDGIREVIDKPPDVVLLDYRLGDADGVHVLREIRARSTWDRPGVAMFTADWDVSERVEEVSALNAIIVSKLCDIDRVGELVAYLSAGLK